METIEARDLLLWGRLQPEYFRRAASFSTAGVNRFVAVAHGGKAGGAFLGGRIDRF